MNKKYYKYIFTFLVLLSSSFLCLNSIKAEEITVLQNECMYYQTSSGALKQWLCKEEKMCIKTCYGTCGIRQQLSGVYVCDGNKKIDVIVKTSTGSVVGEAKYTGGREMLDDVRNFVTTEKDVTVKKGECGWLDVGNIKNWYCNDQFLCNETCTKTCVVRPQLTGVYTCPGKKKDSVKIVDNNGNELTDEDVTGGWDQYEEVDDKQHFFDDWSDIPAVLSGVSEIVNGEISCEGETGVLGKAWKVLQTIFTLIKIIGIALLIVLSMLDFMKAVTADDAGVMKKATKNAIVRMAVVVVLFMLPALINLILKITYISSGTCGIK